MVYNIWTSGERILKSEACFNLLLSVEWITVKSIFFPSPVFQDNAMLGESSLFHKLFFSIPSVLNTGMFD